MRPLFLMLLLCAVCHGADDLRPPAKYRLAIELNLKSNLPNRRIERDGPETIEGERIFHWDVPVDDISKGRLHESPFIDAASRDFSFVEKKVEGVTRRFVRIFARPEDKDVVTAYRQHYGEPQKQFLAVKLVSHATYFVWDPKAPNKSPFSVKLIGGNTVNWAAEQTVKMSDVVERLVTDTPSKSVAFFPERLGVSHLGMTQVVRSWNPVGFEPGLNEMLLPAHGVLGSKDVMLRLAKLAGLKTAEEWVMKEYLPELAKNMAHLHFAQGIYPELHTQNLTLNVNLETGKVKGIVFQDITDAMIDPTIRLAQNRRTFLETMRDQSRASVLHTRHIEENTESILHNFVGYVSQSVLNWIDFHAMPGDTAEILAKLSSASYLLPYLEKAAEITKVPLKLGPAGQVAQKLLFGGHVTDAEMDEHFPGVRKIGPKERTAFLLGSILHDSGAIQTGTLLAKHHPDFVKFDQRMLRDVFRTQVYGSLYQTWNKADGEVIARNGVPTGAVEYYYWPGRGIIAMKNGQPVAIAHSLGLETEGALRAAAPPGSIKPLTCGADASAL